MKQSFSISLENYSKWKREGAQKQPFADIGVLK